jgi:hypothetical protein
MEVASVDLRSGCFSVVLALLTGPAVADGQSYDRAAFGQDVNAYAPDCMSLRHDLLTARADMVLQHDEAECRVLTGLWIDPYTGERITVAAELQVDHLIPLAWAWEHGADSWTQEERQEFSLDQDYLRVVSQHANASKGDSGPTEWLPTAGIAQCDYVSDFRTGVAVYGLQLSEAEQRNLEELTASVCGSLPRLVKTIPQDATAAAPVLLASRDLDCADFATQVDAQANLDSSGAVDPHGLDRNGDGVACEHLP